VKEIDEQVGIAKTNALNTEEAVPCCSSQPQLAAVPRLHQRNCQRHKINVDAPQQLFKCRHPGQQATPISSVNCVTYLCPCASLEDV
jgi:hypothetical protein